MDTIKQGDSDSEVTMCFGANFNFAVDLTVIQSGINFGIYLMSLSLTICGIVSAIKAMLNTVNQV